MLWEELLAPVASIIDRFMCRFAPPGEPPELAELLHRAKEKVAMAEQSQGAERDRLLSEADNLYSEVARRRAGRRLLARVWAARARCARGRGLDKLAQDDLQQALSYWRRCPEAHLELARLYANQGDIDRAVRHCRKALRNGDTRSDARRLMEGLTRGGRRRPERRLVGTNDTHDEEEIVEGHL